MEEGWGPPARVRELTDPLVAGGDPARPLEKTARKKLPRLHALDLTRGIIMIVMSWDHCRDLLSQRRVATHGSETWSGPFSDYDNNGLVFFQRWISHFCAPGFFFLMGVGMVFLAKSRQRHGWTDARIVRYFQIRGILLLIVGRLVDMAILPDILPMLVLNISIIPTGPRSPFRGPAWAVPFIGIWEVMTALSFTMMSVGAVLPGLLSLQECARKLRLGQLAAVSTGVAMFACSTLVLLAAQGGDPCGTLCTNSTAPVPWPRWHAIAENGAQVMTRFLLIPGQFANGSIMYPLVPWGAITLFGVAAGLEFRSDPERAFRGTALSGILCVAAFTVIRWVGGPQLGNLRGWPRQEGSTNPVIAFLSVCKYPPSVAYALLTLGVDFLVVSGAHFCCTARSATKSPVSPGSRCLGSRCCVRILTVFGQVPLFFYILHFWVYGIVSSLIRWFSPHGISIVYLAPIWIFLVCCIYPACIWYRSFKANKSMDSWWRML